MAAYQQSSNAKAFCAQNALNASHMAEAAFFSQQLQKALRQIQLNPGCDSAHDPEAILRCVLGSQF